MKPSIFSLVLGGLGLLMVLELAGCSSAAPESSASPPQRAQLTVGDKSIPTPAQGMASQQEQRKTQLDAMRAKDASAAH